MKQKDMNGKKMPFLVDKKSLDLLLAKAQKQVYKTFDDLEFKPHEMFEEFKRFEVYLQSISPKIYEMSKGAKHAIMNFDNGYGVSVVFGEIFHSNGVDTYELAVLKDGKVCTDYPITNDVMGYLSKDMVSEIMINVQKLPKGII